MLNILFVRALNARIASIVPLIVDTPNPGLTVSELRRDLPQPYKAMMGLAEKALAFTTEEGSRQLVYASVGGEEDPNKMRGAFISMGDVQEVSDFVLSKEGGISQERIWVSCFCILFPIPILMLTLLLC